MITSGLICQAVVSGALNGGIYALIALTLALMFGVMRVMNFAHGDLLMIAMYGIFLLNAKFGLHPFVGAVAMVPVMAVIGFCVYRVLIRPILNASLLMQAQLTVGLSFVIQSLALIFFGADLLNLKTSLEGVSVRPFGIVLSAPLLIGFAVSLFVCLLVSWFLLATEAGYRVRATAQDAVMAKLCGVDVPLVQELVFVCCVALLAIPAGCLMTFYYVTPFVGIQFTLTSLLIVVLGGIGDMKGAFVGAILIGIVESLAGALVNGAAAPAVVYVIFGLGLLFRPRGILGKGSHA